MQSTLSTDDSGFVRSRRARLVFLCVATLVILTTLNAWLHSPERREHANVETVHVRPVEAFRHVEFGVAEMQLADLDIDARAPLVFNHALANAMTVAVTPLLTTESAAAIHRLQQLLRVGWGEIAGEQLAQLAYRFYRFRLRERELHAAITGTDVSADQQRFEATQTAQREWFSPDAIRQLFGRENALMMYTLALRSIEADSALSPDERERARERLQRTYEEELAAL